MIKALQIGLFMMLAVATAQHAHAQSWGSIGTTGTLTSNRVCYTDATDIICDSSAPTLAEISSVVSGSSSIVAGDTSVSIVDSGTGSIQFDVDGTTTGLLGPNKFTLTAADGANSTTTNRVFHLKQGANSRFAIGSTAFNAGASPAGIYIETFNDYDMVFMPDGVEAMRITNDGFVFVDRNTDSLYNNFRVYGAGSPYAALGQSSNVAVLSAATGSTENTALAFHTALAGTESEAMRISHSGYVGIGTTSPASFLDINSTITSGTGFDLFSAKVSSGSSEFVVRQSNADHAYLQLFDTAGNEDFRLRVDGNSWINSTGNFGIGTTSPSVTLEVSGTAHFKNVVGSFPLATLTPYDYVAKLESSDGGAHLILQDSASTSNGNSIGVVGDELRFRTAGNTVMEIDATGNVGIGTTSPAAALHVAGTGTKLINLHSTDNGAAQYRLITDSGNRRIVARNSADTATETQIVLSNTSIELAGPSNTSDLWGTFDGTGLEVSGTVTADNFVGDGSGLTGLTATPSISGSAGQVLFNSDGSTLAHASDIYWDETNDRLGINTSSPWGAKIDIVDEEAGPTIYMRRVDDAEDMLGITFRPSTTLAANSVLQYHAGMRVGTNNFAITGYDGTSANYHFLTIKPNGDIGLNTELPEAPFHVTNVSTTTEDPIAKFTSGGDRDLSILQPDSADGNDPWTFFTNNAFQFRVDSSESLSINAAGRVGVGTTSPSYTLDVSGTVHAGQGITINSPSVGTAFVVNAADTNPKIRMNANGLVSVDNLSGFANDGSLNIGGGAAYNNGGNIILSGGSHATIPNVIRFRAGTTEIARFDASGNLGIGTTNPARPLDVNGSVRVVDGGALEWGGTTAHISGSSSSNTLFFATNGTERMRIDSSGNVGIGTNAPSTALDVSGTVTADAFAGDGSSLTGVTASSFDPAGSDMQLLFNSGGDSVAAASALYWNEASDRLGVGTTGPSYDIEVRRADANPKILVRNTDSSAARYPGLAVENYMGSTTGHPAISMQNANGTFGAQTALSSGELLGTMIFSGARSASANSQGARITAAATGNWSATSAPTTLSFSTTNVDETSYTERMRISHNGNVGIGTTTPSTPLHVYTNASGTDAVATIQSAFAGEEAQLRINANAGYASIIYQNNSTSRWLTGNLFGDDSFRIYDYTGARNVLRAFGNGDLALMDGGGNVGIGTTSPAQELDVLSSGTGIARFMRDLTTDTGLLIDASANGPELKTQGAHNLDIYTNGTARMRIDPSGNVGIGTTSPVGNLEVSDPSSNAIVFVDAATGSNARIFYGDGGGIDWNVGHNGASGNFQFYDNNTTTTPFYLEQGAATGTLVVDTNSRVGIGTNAPATALDVSGTVTADAFAGDGSNLTNVSASDFDPAGSDKQILFNSGGSSVAAASQLYWDETNDHLGFRDTTPDYDFDFNFEQTGTSGTQYSSYKNYTVSVGSTSTGNHRGNYDIINTSASGANDIGQVMAKRNYGNHNGTGTVSSLYAAENTVYNTSTGTVTNAYGAYNMARNNSTGTVTNAYGAYNMARNQSTGDVGSLYGAFNYALNAAGGNVTASARGTYSLVRNNGAGSIPTVYNVYAVTDNASTGSITNAYGLYPNLINDGGGTVTNYYGIYLPDESATATNSWGVYVVGDRSYFGGNVGIGTNDPSQALHVFSSGNTQALISSSFSNSTNTGMTINTTGDSSMGRILFTKDSTSRGGLNYLHNASGGAERIDLSVAGTTGMSVLGTGNVGIGTNTPSRALHISTASDANNITLHGPGSAYGVYHGFFSGNYFIVNQDDNNITFGTNNTGRMVIANTGNVGIGTSSPDGLLTVESSAETVARVRTTAAGDNAILRLTEGNDLGGFIRYHSSDHIFSLGVNNDNVTDVDVITMQRASGNVGIGTTSPDAKLTILDATDNSAIDVRTNTGGLDVRNTSAADGAHATIRLTSRGTSDISGADGNFIQSVGNANNDTNLVFGRFDSTGTIQEHVRILKGGNLGIGTDSPSYKLEVSGAAAGTTWTNLSDRRHKKNITDLVSPLDKIQALRGVSYEWKEASEPALEGTKLGVIAQEVEEVYPEVVVTGTGGTKRVDYQALVAPLIEAVKEQQKQIEALKAEVEALKTK